MAVEGTGTAAVVVTAIVAGWASALACVKVKGCIVERARQIAPAMGATSVMKPKTVSTQTSASAGVLTPISLPNLGERATSADTIAATWEIWTLDL